MGLMLLIIAGCLICGLAAAFAVRNPSIAPHLAETLAQAHKPELKSFSPKRTLFLIGPDANHTACKMQRRLLKPALAALIRDEVSVVELYGATTPRKNGELMKWLDPALMRHAMNAEEGFFVIYVDDNGKTLFRNEAPMVGADILALAGIKGLTERRLGDRRSEGRRGEDKRAARSGSTKTVYREVKPLDQPNAAAKPIGQSSDQSTPDKRAVLRKLRST